MCVETVNMSYTIILLDPDTHRVLEHGNDDPYNLSITYNYSEYYRMAFNHPSGIRCLYGKSGASTTLLLETAIAKLPNNTHSNYWEKTGGNAKKPLKQLLKIAKLNPKGIWDGD